MALPGKPYVSNSVMWQSPRWSAAVDTVVRFRGTPPVPRGGPLLHAIRLLFRRGRYRAVLTAGPRPTMLYGLLCRLAFARPKQVVIEYWLGPPPSGLLSRLADRVKGAILRRALGIVVNAREEVDLLSARYGIARERIAFVPFHTNVLEPEVVLDHEHYVFSAGRTGRDWTTLVDAMRGLPHKAILVCGRDDLPGVVLPSNVVALREIPYEEYLRLLRGATVVVVPLLPANRSTGQVAVLEAMAYGKPVVATNCLGTRDYVEDRVDALLTDPGDVEDLRRALTRLLLHDDLRERLGRAAHASVLARFTFDAHAAAKLAAIDRFAGRG